VYRSAYRVTKNKIKGMAPSDTMPRRSLTWPALIRNNAQRIDALVSIANV